MSEIMPQDTPIVRATILDLDAESLQEYVQTLQARRLAAYNVYQMGKEAKKRTTDERDAALLAKTIASFEKQHETVLRQLNKLEKLATDIQAARIASGDL